MGKLIDPDYKVKIKNMTNKQPEMTLQNMLKSL